MVPRLDVAGGAAVLVACLCTACGGDAPPAFVAIDSAGVRIAQNWFSEPSVAPYALASEPRLRIGSIEGSSSQTLHRVSDAITLADGSVVVANTGASEVLVFDEVGERLRVLGRDGQGPGEFLRVSRIGEYDGGLWAFDNGLRRITYFDAAGSVESTTDIGFFELGGRDQTFSDVRLAADGAIVGLDWSHLSRGSWPGTSLDTAFWAVRTPEGADEIARLPGAETVRFEVDGSRLFRTLPLTAVPSWDLRSDKVYHTSGSAFEVRVSGLDGRLEQIVRLGRERTAVDQRIIEEWQESIRYVSVLLGSDEDPQPFFDAVPMADSLPAYDAVHATAGGVLWAQVARAHPVLERSWDVFDAEGRFLGTVEMPVGLRVSRIYPDHVVGVTVDELGVEYVEVWELTRQAGEEPRSE